MHAHIQCTDEALGLLRRVEGVVAAFMCNSEPRRVKHPIANAFLAQLLLDGLELLLLIVDLRRQIRKEHHLMIFEENFPLTSRSVLDQYLVAEIKEFHNHNSRCAPQRGTF